MQLENQFIELVDITNIKSVGKQPFVSLNVDDQTFALASGLMLGTNSFPDTPVQVLRAGSYLAVPAKEIQDGDAVLTHTNHLREVSVNGTGSSVSMLISTALGDAVMSHQSKVPAYNSLSNEFGLVEVIKLDAKIHKLIKNRLVEFQKLIEIASSKHLFTNPKYDFVLELSNGETISTSKSHKFSAFDMETMGYVFIPAGDINPDIHALVIA